MKKIITILLCLSLLLSISCGENSNASQTTSQTTSENPENGERDDSLYSFNEVMSEKQISIKAGETHVMQFDINLEYDNYLKIEFETDISLLGNLTYVDNDNPLKGETEPFFIQKDVREDFYQIIDPNYDNVYERKLVKIEFKNVDSNSGIFNLSSIKIGEREGVDNGQIFISNEYLKVGANLFSGGAINHIEDLANRVVQVTKPDKTIAVGVDYDKVYKDSTLTDTAVNLINTYDKGRLVQQAYYGTKDLPYVTGMWSGRVWSYNPVQGGDCKNTSSRLCDYIVSDDYLYVKVMPMDWAKTNSVTPSYMENWYTIDGNLLNVSNRFIDFSGYNHPHKNQELPAFYGVAPLHTYAGVKGNNQDITYNDNLPFWGNGYTEDTRWTNLTENWFAWVNEDKYGVGVMTPNITTMIMGRTTGFSTTFSGDATNQNHSTYGAMIGSFALKTYQVFEYEYFISVGFTSDLRQTFNNIDHTNTNLLKYEGRIE